MMAWCDRARADWRPYAAHDWLQSEPMLVGRERFDRDAGMGRGFFGDDLGDFFEVVLLRGGRGLGVSRPRLLDRPADRFQRFPAALRRDLLQPQLIGHPARDLAARPHPAVGRRLVQTHTKPVQQLRLQNRRDAAIVSPKIPHRARPQRVVAFEQLLDPAKPERRDLGHFARRMAFGEQKNRLQMPRRRHVLARLVTRLQLRNAQMVDDPSHVRLPRIMALLSISPIPPQESHLVESITRKPYH